MNKWKSGVMAALLLPWIMSAAYAESITIPVTATVSMVDDPYGVVPEIMPGSTISGEYTYETTTPDQDPAVQIGFYPHASGTGQLNLSVGGYQVMSETTQANGFEVFIDDEYSPGNELYSVRSMQLLPSNGASFNFAAIDLWASNANALQNAALTSTAPDPALFTQKTVYIDGTKNGQYFHVSADVNALGAGTPGTSQQTRYEYKATALVTYVYDPSGVLAGKLGINSAIAAGFTFDLTTPNSSTYPGEGLYQHVAGTGSVSVSFGDVTLSTDPTAYTPDVHVFNSDDPTGWDHFGMIGNTIVSTSPAIAASNVDVMFDGPGTILSSIDLPAGNLSLSGWNDARVFVGGYDWYFEATITGLELVQIPAVEIFPADGTVHPLQRFDMALRTNEQAPVMGISGVNNGQDISPYLSGCIILPKLELTQSVVCPETTSVLMPGANALQLQLMLEDGSTLDTGVNWEVRE